MILLFLLLLASARAQNATTFWYMLNPGVYNFSNYTIAYKTTQALSLPLHARDGATIYANDTVPAITTTFTLIGDVNNGIGAFVTIEILQSPIFFISGAADVYMRNLQFTFNNTLFNTRDNSLLTLSSVNIWLGAIGIVVQNNAGPGIGLLADHFQCMNTRICLLYLGGSTATCTDCRFMNARPYTGTVTSAVAVSSTAQSAINGLTIKNSLWINTQFFLYAQSSPQAVPVSYPLPTNWGFINNNVIARTYEQDCVPPSQSQTPSFKFGGSVPENCPTCTCGDDSRAPSNWQIFLLVLLGAAFIAAVVINLNSQFAGNSMVYTAVRQEGTPINKTE
jgi:hypothetical protein